MYTVAYISFILFQIASTQVVPYGLQNTPQTGIRNVGPDQNIAAGIPVGNLANNIANNIATNTLVPVPAFEAGNGFLASNILGNEAFNLATHVRNNLVGVNGNVATFSLGGDGHTFTVTSGSPGSPGFNIEVAADALEIGGKVSVNGQIPIYGTVSVNGNVPTDGTATVNYNCGTPAATLAAVTL